MQDRRNPQSFLVLFSGTTTIAVMPMHKVRAMTSANGHDRSVEVG